MSGLRGKTGVLILVAVGMAESVSAQSVCRDSWTLRETLRVGSAAGEVAFSGVAAMTIGPDGAIYVAQQQVPAVLVLSPQGQRLRTIGRAGRGLGGIEGSATLLGWRADTLWVSDRYKTQFIDQGDDPLYEVRFRHSVPNEGSVFSPAQPMADGSFLGRRRLSDYREWLTGPDEVAVLRFSRTGEVLDTLALVGWTDRVIEYEWDRGSSWVVAHPLMYILPGGFQEYLVAPAPDGSAILTIGGIRQEGTASTFDILKIGVTGDTLLARPVAYEPRPVSPAESERLREALAGWLAGDYMPPASQQSTDPRVRESRREWVRDAFWSPDVHPPVREIVAGHDGSIWLLRESELGGNDRWEVYDEQGALLGSLLVQTGRSKMLPWAPRLTILRASRNEVWGTTLDGVGVPYLHRYEVEKPCG